MNARGNHQYGQGAIVPRIINPLPKSLSQGEGLEYNP